MRTLARQQRQAVKVKPCNPATPRGVRNGWSGGLGLARPDAPEWVTAPSSIVSRMQSSLEIWIEGEENEGSGSPLPPALEVGKTFMAANDAPALSPRTPRSMEPSPRELIGPRHRMKPSDYSAQIIYKSDSSATIAEDTIAPSMSAQIAASLQSSLNFWQVLPSPYQCCSGSEAPPTVADPQLFGKRPMRQKRHSIGEITYDDGGEVAAPLGHDETPFTPCFGSCSTECTPSSAFSLEPACWRGVNDNIAEYQLPQSRGVKAVLQSHSSDMRRVPADHPRSVLSQMRQAPCNSRPAQLPRPRVGGA